MKKISLLSTFCSRFSFSRYLSWFFMLIYFSIWQFHGNFRDILWGINFENVKICDILYWFQLGEKAKMCHSGIFKIAIWKCWQEQQKGQQSSMLIANQCEKLRYYRVLSTEYYHCGITGITLKFQNLATMQFFCKNMVSIRQKQVRL